MSCHESGRRPTSTKTDSFGRQNAQPSSTATPSSSTGPETSIPRSSSRCSSGFDCPSSPTSQAIRFGRRSRSSRAGSCVESLSVPSRRVLIGSLPTCSRISADSPHESVGDAAETFLRRQTSAVGYWPDDAEVRRELRTLPIYRRLRRGRLRMILEAIEDHLRGFDHPRPKHEQPVIREICTIEHIMPQDWRRHWPLDNGATEEERDRRVHTLGNLTLVTQSLNSKVSNAAWASPGGKREALNAHSSLLMTRAVTDRFIDGWDDDDIDERTGGSQTRSLRSGLSRQAFSDHTRECW